jgi:DNA primase
MAQYSDSVLQEIRSRVDIVDLVGQYVPLRRAGANHKGLCPFHKEKTPSFHVHPERQIYRCFGCGASGNVFGFLMQYEGLGFPEAVRMLAERAGVTLDKSGPAGPTRQLTDRLKQIHKAAATLYARMLHSGREGEAARKYLAGRGLDLAQAKELGLGYAPESWDFARTELTRQGFELSELEASGLIKKSAESAERMYDRFRNRLLFPITDPYGTVIGFGGRTLGDDQAKYINSPESPIYHKGKQLFGLHLARDAIKEQGWLFLVEGNFDCVLPWSRGIKNVAAPLGTSLTADHARLIKRYTDRVTLLFDQDEAGQTSQRRAAELLLGEGFEVRVATLDRHKDPADYVLHEGAEALRKRLDAAEHSLVFYARRAVEEIGEDTPRARAKAVAGLLPLIDKVLDPIERAESLAYVARKLGVDETLVREQVEHRPSAAIPVSPQAASLADGPLDEVERYLLRALVARPELLVLYLEQRDPAELRSSVSREILGAMSELYSGHQVPQTSELLDRIESDPVKRQVAAWAFEAESIDVLAQFYWCLQELNQRKLKQESVELQRRIREAERSGDQELAMKLAMESLHIARERHVEHLQAPTLPVPKATATGQPLKGPTQAR